MGEASYLFVLIIRKKNRLHFDVQSVLMRFRFHKQQFYHLQKTNKIYYISKNSHMRWHEINVNTNLWEERRAI